MYFFPTTLQPSPVMGKLPRQKVKYFLPAAQVTLKGLAWKCAVAAAVTANL